MWPGSSPRPRFGRRVRLLCCHRADRPQTRLQRDSEHQLISAKALALSLPKEAWQTVIWREGSAERLSSRFARQRVRAAYRDTELSQPRAEEWLLIEWPEDETEPTKYWFATLPGYRL
jgi:SRSO17 transposase